MASETVEDVFYDYWNALLDGEKPPFYDGGWAERGGGTYWMKGQRGQKLPVRIERIEPDVIGSPVKVWVNGEVSATPNEVWIACGRNAVTYDAYMLRMARGAWPDEAITGLTTITGLAGMGDNAPPPTAVHELLPYMVERIRSWFVGRLGQKIETAADIQAASDHAHTLRTLMGKAKKLHKQEKGPSLEAGKAVDEKYNPNIKEADALIDEIGKAVAAARGAEHQARAQTIAKATEGLKDLGLKDPSTLLPPIGEPEKIRSSTGKRGFTIVTVETAEVIDQDALYCATKHRPEVVAFFAKLAQTSLDSGTLLPGVFKKEGLEAK